MVYPWENIVRLCKRYGALSLVDAAHAIGQVKTDVKRADCDFWVSVGARFTLIGQEEKMLTTRTATNGYTPIVGLRSCIFLYGGSSLRRAEYMLMLQESAHDSIVFPDFT